MIKSYVMKATGLATGLAAALLVTTAPVQAAAIVPVGTSFGTLAGATFSGSGIPNTAVQMFSGSGLTLGLTAHQRYVGPNLANNGAGTFTAFVGNSNTIADPYATWNVGFYVAGSPTALAGAVFRLLYDFNPGAGTDESVHGFTLAPGAGITTSPAQGSWNMGMDFLATAAVVPGVGAVTPPSFVPFNPYAAGEYTFSLVANAFTVSSGGAIVLGAELGRASILVNVVPEPGSLALVGVALLGLAGLRRRS